MKSCHRLLMVDDPKILANGELSSWTNTEDLQHHFWDLQHHFWGLQLLSADKATPLESDDI